MKLSRARVECPTVRTTGTLSGLCLFGADGVLDASAGTSTLLITRMFLERRQVQRPLCTNTVGTATPMTQITLLTPVVTSPN